MAILYPKLKKMKEGSNSLCILDKNNCNKNNTHLLYIGKNYVKTVFRKNFKTQFNHYHKLGNM